MACIKNLTHEQRNAVDELQMRMKRSLTPHMLEDATVFYRFLKARDFDVDKAEKMLKKTIAWRKMHRADTILQDFKPKEFFIKYPNPSFVGHDKDGDLVIYGPGGKVNVHEVFKCVTMNDFLKHWIWRAAKDVQLLEENNAKTGKKGYQVTLIADLEGLTLENAVAKLTMSFLFRMLQMHQDNYPEHAKYLYVINAPSFFVYPFSIVKPMITGATIKKIHIYGCNGWKQKLLEFIDADVLPAFLGGNRTDPDGNPLCESSISFGGEIPRKYFLSKEERYFSDHTQVKKIILPSSEKKEIYVDVKEEGSMLHWEFLVKGKDIGFGLIFETPEQEIFDLIPVHKVGTSDGTEKDSYKCNSAGKYFLIFENTHSWITSKEVEYYVYVVSPKA